MVEVGGTSESDISVEKCGYPLVCSITASSDGGLSESTGVV